MLGVRSVLTRLPAKDLARARRWYSEKLGFGEAGAGAGGGAAGRRALRGQRVRVRLVPFGR